MTKINFKKTTKTVQTLYIIPMPNDTSNKNKKYIDNEANNRKKKFCTLSFKKRQSCLSNNGYTHKWSS